MGGALSSCACCAAESLACCACSSLMKACCCCGGGDSKISSKTARILYCLMVFTAVIIGASLSAWGTHIFIDYGHYIKVNLFTTDCDDAECVGNQLIYRVSFTYAMFFGFMSLLLMGTKSPNIHCNGWGLKLLVITLLCFISLYIPNDVAEVYAEITRYVSSLFILAQILLLIDFAYSWNESWVAKEERKWLAGLLASSVLMNMATLVIIVLQYVYFASGECGLEKFFVSFNLILWLLMLVLSIWAEHGALLTGSVVCLFVTYTGWSALDSDPSECNSLADHSGGNTFQIVGGLVFSGLSLAFTSFRTSGQEPNVFHNGESTGDAEPLLDEEGGEGEGGKKSEIVDEKERRYEEEQEAKRQNYPFFHFVMCVASMYMCMILTNWGAGATDKQHDVGLTSMWVKTVSQWLTCLLYIWTLIAPSVFPDREFS